MSAIALNTRAHIYDQMEGNHDSDECIHVYTRSTLEAGESYRGRVPWPKKVQNRWWGWTAGRRYYAYQKLALREHRVLTMFSKSRAGLNPSFGQIWGSESASREMSKIALPKRSTALFHKVLYAKVEWRVADSPPVSSRTVSFLKCAGL